MHAEGQFEITKWNEERYAELGEQAKLSRASVTQSFRGDIEGEGAVEYLMMYEDEATARYIGQQRITGSIDGRSGTIVLHLSGTFDGGKAEAEWSVVPGSGTEQLHGLRGQGGFSAPLGETASYWIDLELS